MSESVQATDAPVATLSVKDIAAKIPEKFKGNLDEMAKAYVELEKEYTKVKSAPKQEEKQTPAPATPPTTPSDGLQIDTAVESDPFAKYADEFSKNGKLSDETYAAIKKAHGLGKQYIDTHIQGLTALAQSRAAAERQAAVELLGGEDALKTHLEWAATNLSPAEKEAFNASTKSGNVEVIKQAVAGLKYKYESANGSDPKLLGGRGADGLEVGTFRSWAEVTAAMRDRRYRTDPAYAKDVEKKMSRSNLT